MIVAVASGKGGTGKTTVAVNMALSLRDIQIVDCDVEEPNVHLFLAPELKETHTVEVMFPEVDEEKCNYCGRCAEICAYNAISVLAGTFIIFPHLCHGCGGCVLLCPEKAMKEGKRQVGIVNIGEKENIIFIEGKLNISEVMAPAVIEKAKSFVDTKKDVIIDAPPGTSCPVVASLKGVDFCVLVTEPTPFGLHDLEIAYQVTKIMNIPSGVVINKSEKDEIIEEFCKKNRIPILMKIPFDKKIAELYSKGIPLVQGLPEYKDKFKKLFETIKEYVK